MVFREGECLPWWEEVLTPGPSKIRNYLRQTNKLARIFFIQFDQLCDRLLDHDFSEIDKSSDGLEEDLSIDVPIGLAREFSLTHPQVPQVLRDKIKGVFMETGIQNDFTEEAYIFTKFSRRYEITKNTLSPISQQLQIKLGEVTATARLNLKTASNTPTQEISPVQNVVLNFINMHSQWVKSVAMLAMVDFAVSDTAARYYSASPLPKHNPPIEPM